MPSNSSSFVLYLSSSLFKNLLAYATGFHMCPCFCSKHAPKPFLLASLFILVSLVRSKCLFSVMLVICFLIFSNAIVRSSFQSSLFCDFVLFFDNSGRRGSESSANLGVNFIK